MVIQRKTDNNAMRRSLQAMLADTPLVKNLDNPNHMKMLLNKKTSLEELFAEIDGMAAVSMKKSDDNSDRILPGYRSLINLPDLPGRHFNALMTQDAWVFLHEKPSVRKGLNHGARRGFWRIQCFAPSAMDSHDFNSMFPAAFPDTSLTGIANAPRNSKNAG